MTLILIVAICLMIILLSIEVITCVAWPIWAGIIILSIVVKIFRKEKKQ